MFKRPIIPLVIFLFLGILFYFNQNFPPIRFIAGVVQGIFATPKTLIYSLKAGGGSDSLQIKKLKRENEALTKKLIDYGRTKRDNEALRSQFETSVGPQYKLMPARVLGFSGNFASPDSLVIDRGSNNGVQPGAAVVFKNYLVGKIDKVTPFYSRVFLSVSENFITVARTVDGSAHGIARGNGDFILFDRVSIKDTIPAGSIIVTKGDVDTTGLGIPPDLIIGKIASVNHNPSLPFQTAKIESNEVLSRLETVFIVLGF